MAVLYRVDVPYGEHTAGAEARPRIITLPIKSEEQQVFVMENGARIPKDRMSWGGWTWSRTKAEAWEEYRGTLRANIRLYEQKLDEARRLLAVVEQEPRHQVDRQCDLRWLQQGFARVCRAGGCYTRPAHCSVLQVRVMGHGRGASQALARPPHVRRLASRLPLHGPHLLECL